MTTTVIHSWFEQKVTITHNHDMLTCSVTTKTQGNGMNDSESGCIHYLAVLRRLANYFLLGGAQVKRRPYSFKEAVDKDLEDYIPPPVAPIICCACCTNHQCYLGDPMNIESFIRVSRGNPGGFSALADVSNSFGMEKAQRIADLLMGSSIYGEDIWILYKDCAECNVVAFVELVETANESAMDILNEYRLNVGRAHTRWEHSNDKDSTDSDNSGGDL